MKGCKQRLWVFWKVVKEACEVVDFVRGCNSRGCEWGCKEIEVVIRFLREDYKDLQRL